MAIMTRYPNTQKQNENSTSLTREICKNETYSFQRETKEHRGELKWISLSKVDLCNVEYGDASGHPERPATSRSNRYYSLGGSGVESLWSLAKTCCCRMAASGEAYEMALALAFFLAENFLRFGSEKKRGGSWDRTSAG